VTTSPAETNSTPARDYYELRAYRLKPDAPQTLLDGYLETALIPALNARGLKAIGVFNEPTAKEGPVVWVLITHPSADSALTISASILEDPAVQQAGREYLNPSAAHPAFDRIDSWLLLAFSGQPRLVLPETSRKKQPRIFEMRTYESFSELKALKKVEMFNAGEIDVMRDVGLAPVFYGQSLVGPALPHLTYMTSAPDLATHQEHWVAFRKHPAWLALLNDPQYAETVSKNTSRLLSPTSYSQI
jgi:hypothetical protein